MIEKVSFAVAALAAAYLLVTLIPGAAPEVAARTAERTSTAQLGMSQASQGRKVACMESWPYYEPNCLHDGRQADGRARIVRIISTERPSL